MSVDARLDMLGRKHAELETQLHDEMKHPALDTRKVHDIKRRKLAIKDEMTTLTASKATR